MLYRGVVLHAFQAACTIALGMTFPTIITCCLGIYDVSGLGHSRPWCRRRWRSPPPPPPPPPPWVQFFFFFFRKKKKFVFKRNKIFSFSKQNGGQNGFKRGGKHVLKKGGWEKIFSPQKIAWDYLLQAGGGKNFGVGLHGSGFFFRHACFQPSVALELLDMRVGAALDEPMHRLVLGMLVGARQCSPWTFVFRRARPVH